MKRLNQRRCERKKRECIQTVELKIQEIADIGFEQKEGEREGERATH